MARFPLCLLLVLMSAPSFAQVGINVLIDNAPITFDQPPVLVGNSVLVPMRGVFERLGADVVWVPEQHAIRATHGSTTIELQLGAPTALINGHPSPLTTPAMTVGGRTLVPLRFISEALGAEVRWSPASRTVAITQLAPQTEQSPAPEALTSAAPMSPAEFSSVRPAENETVNNPRPRVVVRVEGGAGLDPSSVRLTIDGHDVTPEVTVSQDEISWSPSSELPAGPATVLVSAQDSAGNRLRKEWNFVVAGPAAIRRVFHNGNHLLAAGELLTVTMEGEPGGQASFNIGSLREHIPMAEVAPGRYVGTYQVQSGDSAADAQVVGHLAVGTGGPPARLEADNPVSIGYPAASPGPALRLESPRPGTMVPDAFLIAGQTVPGAVVTVNVRVAAGRPYHDATNVLNTQVVAGSTGYFEVPFQAQVPFQGGEYVVTVTAFWNNQPSSPAVVTVLRQ